MSASWSSRSLDRSTSVDASPVFVASIPPSEVPRPSSVAPFVLNYTAETLDVDDVLSAATANGARPENPTDVAPVPDEDIECAESDARGRAAGERHSGAPRALGDGRSSSRLLYGQSRPGPNHGLGGRKKGTGHRTRENLGFGLRRALGDFLCDTTIDSLTSECGASSLGAQATMELLDGWAGLPGSEQVWFVPGVFGVVARWREWSRDSAGDAASVCVWVGA